MANGVFNISKGAVIEKIRDGGGTWKVAYFKTIEVDDTLNNYITLAAIKAVAGNVECDFSGYARKAITPNITVSNTANTAQAGQTETKHTFDTSVGAVENVIVKAVYFHDVDGTDANAVPLTFHDLNVNTTGLVSLDVNLPAAWYTAN